MYEREVTLQELDQEQLAQVLQTLLDQLGYKVVLKQSSRGGLGSGVIELVSTDKSAD